jgi:Methyltransferase domain
MFSFESPDLSLPILSSQFSSVDEYVNSLLQFATTSHQLQTFCGGVHILDFFTRSPSLYLTVVPEDWLDWFERTELYDILDFILRNDLDELISATLNKQKDEISHKTTKEAQSRCACKDELPPISLIEYIIQVRRHALVTEFHALPLPDRLRKPKVKGIYKPSLEALEAGMNIKKRHEVANFARYVAGLTNHIGGISHIVDFGSGANYLGRTLASETYNKHVIAVESRPHVVQGAKKMDQRVKLVEKNVIMRNKKKFFESGGWKNVKKTQGNADECEPCIQPAIVEVETQKANLEIVDSGTGSVQYVQHKIEIGDLSAVIEQIVDHPDLDDDSREVFESSQDHSEPLTPSGDTVSSSKGPNIMVISLHSCGNLIHHGLRTLTQNPTVKAVAMIGCCYNLATERLTPQSYKHPSLKLNGQKIVGQVVQADPHGFPMSNRFMTYRHKSIRSACCALHENSNDKEAKYDTGIRLNITARMMGVQAPRNWTRSDSESFFTRHFYRAVLQRIFLDHGIVQVPDDHIAGRSPAGTGSAAAHGTTPVVIGGLPKSCYSDFVAYVRGAVNKLIKNSMKDVQVVDGDERPSASNTPHPLASLIHERLSALCDEEISAYETKYLSQKKHISIVWSLMAFSAQIVEALMVVDRWQWLKEQDCVGDAWVNAVFDYSISPRNMVVVGIRK